MLLALDYETLRAILKVLPESDVEVIADIVTAVGVAQLVAFALCLLAIPQALRYTRWMHDETEPRLASSTARGFPPPPIPAARGSVWQLPIVAPEESRSRRRLYFAFAGFAIGFGAGIGVLVSSSAQRPAGGGAASAPSFGAGSIASARPAAPDVQAGSQARLQVDPAASGGGGAEASRDASGSGGPEPAVARQPATPVEALIQAQLGAIAKGDLAALTGMLAPGAFAFGVDADEVAEGKAAVGEQLRKDIGELVQGGASADLRFSAVGEAHGHTWIALDLDIVPAGQPPRRFAITELAAWVGGAWTVVAWHWAIPVLDKAAERVAALGTKPSPKPIASALTGPGDLEAAVREAFGSRRAFAAARSEHEHAFNFGSGPSERVLGGEAVKRVFGHLKAEIRLHDGVRVVAAGAWDPAQKDAPAVAFAAANVDFKTRTRAATELTHTFRVLAIFVREGRAWKIVQTQWSHGGPIR